MFILAAISFLVALGIVIKIFAFPPKERKDFIFMTDKEKESERNDIYAAIDVLVDECKYKHDDGKVDKDWIIEQLIRDGFYKGAVMEAVNNRII